MTIPVWQPGTQYAPGAIVRPISAPPPPSFALTNGDFNGSAAGWDLTGGVVYDAGTYSGGPGSCAIPGGQPSGEAINQTQIPTEPGASITATCVIHQGASDVDHTRGWVILRWYDSGGVQIGAELTGNVVNDGRGGACDRCCG